MEFYLKIYNTSDEYLVAICDKHILGETIIHNGVKIKVSTQFYGNIDYTSEEVLAEINKSTSVNVFGKNICKLLIKHNLIFPDAVIWMKHKDDEVGHAILIR